MLEIWKLITVYGKTGKFEFICFPDAILVKKKYGILTLINVYNEELSDFLLCITRVSAEIAGLDVIFVSSRVTSVSPISLCLLQCFPRQHYI